MGTVCPLSVFDAWWWTVLVNVSETLGRGLLHSLQRIWIGTAKRTENGSKTRDWYQTNFPTDALYPFVRYNSCYLKLILKYPLSIDVCNVLFFQHIPYLLLIKNTAYSQSACIHTI
jgi:hypothetical protein